MITFSLSPTSPSLRPSIAASVSTRVVSWNDAAESHESVASDAFVIPMSSGRPSAGLLALLDEPPVVLGELAGVDLLARAGTASRPAPTRSTRRSIWRTITSMCLSWIDTPCSRYTFCTSSTRYCWVSRTPLISRMLLRVERASCRRRSSRSPAATSSPSRIPGEVRTARDRRTRSSVPSSATTVTTRSPFSFSPSRTTPEMLGDQRRALRAYGPRTARPRAADRA